MSGPAQGSDQITLIQLLVALLRRWRLLVWAPVLLAVVVVAMSLMRERTYRASAAFVPQASDGGNASTARSFARQFGFTIGGDRAAESPHVYAELLRGPAVLRRVVEAEYTLPDVDGVSSRATLIQIYGSELDRPVPPPWLRAARTLSRNMTVSIGRETSIVRVSVSAEHPELAEQIVARLLETLNEVNIEMKQSRARQESRFVAERIDQARSELAAAEHELQSFLQSNRVFQNAPELVFEHDRFQRQVAMRQEIYTSLMQMYEQSRLDAVRDVPVVIPVEAPAGSAEPEARQTAVRMVLSLVLGWLVLTVAIIGRELMGRARVSNPDQFQEFDQIRREVGRDIRSPSRWFGSNGVVQRTADRTAVPLDPRS